MIAQITPTGIGWRVIVDDGEEVDTLDVDEARAWLERHYAVVEFEPQPDGLGGFMTCVSRREETVSA